MAVPVTADSVDVMPRHGFRTAPAALALAAVIVLTGCTATVTPDRDAGGPERTVSASDDAPTTEATPTEATASNEATAPSEGSRAGESPYRQWLRSDLDRQVTCGGGSLTIDEFALAVEITDDCDEVVIAADSVTVVAQNVGSLTVRGFATDVSVLQVDTVTLEEDSVTVGWEQGNPKVTGEAFAADVVSAWELEPR